MQDAPTIIRFTDSLSGRFAALLLVLIGLSSMSQSTNFVYSHVPALLGMGLILLCVLYGLVRGYRFPSIPLMAWLSLGVGGYFFCRASVSYSQLEGANVMALVLGAAVFYIAGIYHGLAKRADAGLAIVLALALLINALYWYLSQQGDLSLLWWGRPDVGLSGPNGRYTAFFFYKNIACVFFAAAGFYLLVRPIWLASWSWWRALAFILALSCIGLSFFCSSRAIYLILPPLLVLGWFIGLVLRLGSGKRMRWYDGVYILGLLALLAGVIYDIAGQQIIWQKIAEIDTHSRTMIWGDLLQVIPQTPWYGFGAGASTWEIVPIFTEWSLPNYAHNEYLQAWVDFGLIGLLCMLAILAWHLLRAWVSLTDTSLSHERRVQVAGALALLLSIAAYAFVDFPWHHFAVVSLTAFLCGILAAPRGEELRLRQFFAATGSRLSLERHQTRAQRGWTTWVFCGFILLLLAGTGDLLWRYAPVWKADWEYNSLEATEAAPEIKMSCIKQATQRFPEADVAFWYCQQAYPKTQQGYQDLSQIWARCIQANPKQLIAATTQAEILSYLGHYEEAENLLRESYPPDGPNRHCLNSWPTYYGMNLLRWSNALYHQGEWSKSLSMARYAYRIDAKSHLTYNIAWRGNPRQDTDFYKQQQQQRNKQRPAYMKKVLQRIKTLQRWGVEPDDSWQLPLRPNGPQSLYQRWGKIPAKSTK